MGGQVVVPGTALLELAQYAADAVAPADNTVTELTFETPLVLPPGAEVRLRVVLGAPDEYGSRILRIHSEQGHSDASGGSRWVRHASGNLGSGEPHSEDPGLDGAWPPEDAAPLDITTEYERFADAGIGYGPAFRGLSAAWRRGAEVFAEVRLPGAYADEAGRYAVHPALLDAALHAIASGLGLEHGLLPFSWSGARLHGRGADILHVRIAPTAAGPETVTITAVDPQGRLVLTVDALALRRTDADRLAAAAAAHLPLHRLQWSASPGTEPAQARHEDTRVRWADTTDENLFAKAAEESGRDGSHLLVDLGPVPGSHPGSPDAARHMALRTLTLVQRWVTGERYGDARLTFVTRRAVDTGDGRIDPAAATAWGLLRSAQAEHPGRIALVDIDEAPASRRALTGAAALGGQLAVREGVLLHPALVRSDPATSAAGLARRRHRPHHGRHRKPGRHGGEAPCGHPRRTEPAPAQQARSRDARRRATRDRAG